MKRCYDLRNNSVDIAGLGPIVSDVAKYHIFGLKMGVNRFTLTIRNKRIVKKDGIDVSFSIKQYNSDLHVIACNIVVRFFSKKSYCEVHLGLYAEARYNYEPYTQKIQEYLYSYGANMIEHDETILRLSRVAFPNSLRGFNSNFPDVYVARDERYSLICDDCIELQRVRESESMRKMKALTRYSAQERYIPYSEKSGDINNDEFLTHIADIRQRELKYYENPRFETGR